MTRTTKTIIGGALATTLLASSALAAGFQRGSPETDVLFAPGTVSIHTGYTYVNPERGFETINGQSGNFGDYTQKYLIPSLAIAFGGEPFSCAAHYTESFAAEADYSGAPGGSLPFQVSSTQSTRAADRVPTLNPGATALSRTQRIEFDSNEFGTTCRVSYTSDAGRFSVLGGLFLEDFNFQGTSFGFTGLNNQFAAAGGQGAFLAGNLNALGLQALLPTRVDSDVSSGYSTGYRIGLAYEYPDIALRAQVMYRSEVEHDDIVGTANVAVLGNAFAARSGQEVALGQLSNVVAGAGLTAASAVGQLNTAGAFKSSLSDVTSPQYLDIKLQTGIADDTLLLASFRWTDWSTNNAVINTISSPLGQTSSYQPYFWDDGYTASLGLGRAFTDRVSGAVSVGYDSGVSSGAETTYTDLYTLSAGMSLKGSEWAELRFGGLIGYWTDGSQSIGEGAYFNGTVGDDVVYAGNASLKFTW